LELDSDTSEQQERKKEGEEEGEEGKRGEERETRDFPFTVVFGSRTSAHMCHYGTCPGEMRGNIAERATHGAQVGGGWRRRGWSMVALVLSGLAIANGTSRDGRGCRTEGSTAFAHPPSAVSGACGVAALLGARPVAALSRATLPQVRTAARLSLRMGDDEAEERLLWSRRLNRAAITLGTNPAEWGADMPDVEERILWSRRLARAVKVLYTDPDLVPFEAMWRSQGGRQGSLMSSEHMLEAVDGCDIEEADVSVAQDEVQDCPARPKLPALKEHDLIALSKGERVQRQTRNGRVGTGMVVVDVDADVSTVFAVLTDIDKYPERIPTVRAAVTYHRAEKLLKTQFQISKFRLQINTELRCARAANMLEFKMDPERPAPFLEDARGFWYLENVASVSGAPRTRIWLVADLACSALLPTAIVDYASARALPRATAWLKPIMEQLAGQLPQIPLKLGEEAGFKSLASVQETTAK